MNSKTAPPLPGIVDWNNSTTGMISNRAQLTLDKKLENIFRPSKLPSGKA